MCQAVELDQSVQQKFHRTREELSSALVERDEEVEGAAPDADRRDGHEGEDPRNGRDAG